MFNPLFSAELPEVPKAGEALQFNIQLVRNVASLSAYRAEWDQEVCDFLDTDERIPMGDAILYLHLILDNYYALLPEDENKAAIAQRVLQIVDARHQSELHKEYTKQEKKES